MNKRECILLVDDNADDRDLAQRALRECKFAGEIATARNGEEGIDFLFRRGKFSGWNKADPKLILLDIKMPGINGIEALEKIKTDPRIRALPVVMLTSSAQESDLKECYRLGANGYVVKPVDFAQYAEAIGIIVQFWCHLNEMPQNSADPATASR